MNEEREKIEDSFHETAETESFHSDASWEEFEFRSQIKKKESLKEKLVTFEERLFLLT